MSGPGGAAGRELYVYYRVPLAAAAQAQSELAAMRALLRRQHARVHSRWLQRVEIRDEFITWMEIHTVPGGLTDDEVTDICHLLLPWPSVRSGPRHVEVFAALSDSVS